MLKLKSISNARKIYVESDYYLPIKIRFEHWNNLTEPRHCWGISRLNKDFLFEISIGEITGELKYITLVSSPKVHFEMPQTSDYIKPEVGLPAFETQEWSRDDYYTKASLDFEVYIKENRVLIVLLPHTIESKIINDRVIFGFDKDKTLCTIEIKDYSEPRCQDNFQV
jgi:hypothetical protein